MALKIEEEEKKSAGKAKQEQDQRDSNVVKLAQAGQIGIEEARMLLESKGWNMASAMAHVAELQQRENLVFELMQRKSMDYEVAKTTLS